MGFVGVARTGHLLGGGAVIFVGKSGMASPSFRRYLRSRGTASSVTQTAERILSGVILLLVLWLFCVSKFRLIFTLSEAIKTFSGESVFLLENPYVNHFCVRMMWVNPSIALGAYRGRPYILMYLQDRY